MKPHTTLFQEWTDFAAAVIPLNAPAVQREEMRKAFYAGAYVMMNVNKRVGSPDIPEEEGVRWMERLDEEIQRFYREMKAAI